MISKRIIAVLTFDNGVLTRTQNFEAALSAAVWALKTAAQRFSGATWALENSMQVLSGTIWVLEIIAQICADLKTLQ